LAPVGRDSVIAFAISSDRPATRIVADLEALGFAVPSMNGLGVVDDELRRISSEHRASRLMHPFEDQPMPPGAVMEIARRVSRPVDSVAERLRSAGYAVAYSASLTDEDRLLLSRSLDGKPPWLSDPEPIPVWHLARAAIKLDKDPHLIARRLRVLGYEVPAGWG
jgi:hypothetical protein